MGNQCCCYKDGICVYPLRLNGLHSYSFERHGYVGSCADCDALTEDELDALCDPEIMGFPSCDTCKNTTERGCPSGSPYCTPDNYQYKWEPRT